MESQSNFGKGWNTNADVRRLHELKREKDIVEEEHRRATEKDKKLAEMIAKLEEEISRKESLDGQVITLTENLSISGDAPMQMVQKICQLGVDAQK
eukprot:TCALIF_06046-PA protein Name:"Protein of unknown function" AED:0.00 eAED:0.00 QI:182/1/1/1/0/0.5/2/35/95